MSVIRLLNDPSHECNLPSPALYPPGQHIECLDVILGGRGANGECLRRYTRTTRFGRPRWADYDYGW